MSSRVRLFMVLWWAGFAGVVSFQLVDFSALIAKLPVPQAQASQMPISLVRLLSIVQPALLVAIAAFAGLVFAPRVGLSAPAAQAFADRRPIFPALRPQLLPGFVGGFVAAPAVIACWLLWQPFLTPSFIARAEDFNRILPPLTRLLYGGFTEEILLRWGLMTFLVWVSWKVGQRGEGRPGSASFVVAIVLSAVLFGIGHLPIAIALNGSPSLAVISYVVFANSIFGIVAGYLYWKWGLESAVAAHALTHGIFLVVLALT